MKLHLFANTEAVAVAAAAEVIETVGEAIAKRGICHLMLAGGRTPERCYRVLRDADLDWSRLHIWFGDERCLPINDAGRNDNMARQALLDYIAVPVGQVHAIRAELGAEQAAALYSNLLEAAPAMDLVLLGMGEDGHTASLFPDHPALTDERPAVPVLDAPKEPAERVSVSLKILNQARRCLMLITGADKQPAMARIRSGERLPAALVEGCEWLVDAAAWGD